MSYQFIHYEKYKLQDLTGIIGEATRTDGFCPHVPRPEAPTVLKGDLAKVKAQLEKEVPNFKRQLKTTVKGKEVICERGLRKDANILLAGTASYPTPGARPGDPDFDRWLKLNMKFLDKEYGDQLQAVILHLDESHPHIHFYVIPRGYDMTNACRADKASKEHNKKTASAQALRDYQQDYNQQVGIYCGMSHTGPRRRRLSRQEWVDETTANKLASDCINRTLTVAGKTRDKNLQLEAELRKARERVSELEQQTAEQEITLGLVTGLGTTPPPADAFKTVKHAPTLTPSGETDFGTFGL